MEEFIHYCSPNQNPVLQIVRDNFQNHWFVCRRRGKSNAWMMVNQRSVRLLSSMAHSSKLLRELILRKHGVYVLDQVLAFPSSPLELLRWTIHTLRVLALKDRSLTHRLTQEAQRVLMEMAQRNWKQWGNNDADDLIKLCVNKQGNLLGG